MVDHRIHRALTGAGAFLLLLYGAGLAWALHAGLGAASPWPAEVPDAAPDPDVVTYRVRTADGEQHMIEIDRRDTAQALLTTTERFGQGVSLERVEAGEALAHRRAAARPAPVALWLFLATLLLPFWFLLSGAAMRRRFRRFDAVFAGLREHLRRPAADLMKDAAIGPRELQVLLQSINRRKGTELMWEPTHDLVVDARLSHFTLVLNYCPRCNTSISARIRADMLDVPACPRCMSTFEGQELDHQRAQIVDRLLTSDPAARGSDRSTGFSPLVFALWVALLPPIAVLYAQGAARGST